MRKSSLLPSNYRVESRPAGDPVQVERAIELLAAAERPIVVTGSGVLWSGAEAELRDFIESTGLPFYTTPQGRGVIPEDHPRSFPGARSMAFREADVVLVVGARANSMLSFLRAPRFSPDACFISVNLDGREIGHNRGSRSESSAMRRWYCASWPNRPTAASNRIARAPGSRN